jgi:toxin secretion/phage lysis holin
MKASICTAAGLLGGLVTAAFGGWDGAMSTLIIFMAVDYISGLICAGVFKRSPKTESGALESRVGLKGLIRKGMMLAVVLVAHRLDLAMGSTYIRDAAVIAFVANEALSILENAGLMGVPIPKVISRAIDVLNEKSEEDDNE